MKMLEQLLWNQTKDEEDSTLFADGPIKS